MLLYEKVKEVFLRGSVNLFSEDESIHTKSITTTTTSLALSHTY